MKPYIILNCAMSLDGRISRKGERVKFSDELDKKRVDELRKSVDGIMVGINTVIVDNPHLTISNKKEENPVRIIVDSKGRIPDDANVLNDKAKTIIAVSRSAPDYRIKELAKKHEVIVSGYEEVDLQKLMHELYKSGIKRLLLEGGGKLNRSMIAENLVDEIQIAIAPKLIGDGVNLIEGEMPEKKIRLVSVSQIGEMILLKYLTR